MLKSSKGAALRVKGISSLLRVTGHSKAPSAIGGSGSNVNCRCQVNIRSVSFLRGLTVPPLWLVVRIKIQFHTHPVTDVSDILTMDNRGTGSDTRCPHRYIWKTGACSAPE
jgi:hypothetical protein